MKTLIINNHTKHLEELVKLFPDNIVIDKGQISAHDPSLYGLIVITGGSNVPTALRHPEAYQTEIDLVRETSTPVLGICLGAEIITQAFGGSLKQLSQEHRGSFHIHIHDQELQDQIKGTVVEMYEAHHVGIKSLPPDFLTCARSDHGIELFKHSVKPIIGIQFHPEIKPNMALIQWILRTLGIEKR